MEKPHRGWCRPSCRRCWPNRTETSRNFYWGVGDLTSWQEDRPSLLQIKAVTSAVLFLSGYHVSYSPSPLFASERGTKRTLSFSMQTARGFRGLSIQQTLGVMSNKRATKPGGKLPDSLMHIASIARKRMCALDWELCHKKT
jgi:hypothetical protein